MKMHIANFLVAICAIVLASIYLIATFRLPSLVGVDPMGPRAFPALIGIAALMLGVVLAFSTLVQYVRTRGASSPETESLGRDGFAGSHLFAVMVIAGWLLGYYLVFEWLGFVLATIPFLFVLFAYFNRGRWVINAAVAIIFPLAIEFFLRQMFGRAPAPGLLSF